jgi:hypothetical protein
MPSLKLKIYNKNNLFLAQSEYGEKVSICYTNKYEDGDWIWLQSDTKGVFCVIRFEDTMMPALVYIKDTSAIFPIPPSGNRLNYSPKSFTGSCQLITARLATVEEISARRCLSFNPYDSHDSKGFYPHAYANVETRGEVVFAARNAIDGIFENSSHGEYPYESWGINKDPNAQLSIDFGHPVVVDEIRLTLRADFPHDNYWTRATIEFSDGSRETFSLMKTADTQVFSIDPRKITGATLKDLIMAEGESLFPALTQIEFYGTYEV